MEQELLTKEGMDMPLQISGFIEQAICNIYYEYPHLFKTVLYTAVSLMFGYGAYKECEYIMKTNDEEEV